MTDRYFPNNFPDDHDGVDPQSPTQLDAFKATITQWLEQQIHRLEQNVRSIDPTDGSVYTGLAGTTDRSRFRIHSSVFS